MESGNYTTLFFSFLKILATFLLKSRETNVVNYHLKGVCQSEYPDAGLQEKARFFRDRK